MICVVVRDLTCDPTCDPPAGGILVLTSPFSWSEEYTDRSNWLGGVYKDGKPLRSVDALPGLLAAMDMEVLVQEQCAPVLLPDHARKFQLLLCHKLVLRRKC